MALSPLILLESVIMAMQLLSFVLYLICSSLLYISSLISLKAGKVFLLYTFRLIINSPGVSLFFSLDVSSVDHRRSTTCTFIETFR